MHKLLAKLRAKRANGEQGFTLIELLVVVVIIGILIAIAIPLYLNYKKGANDKAAQSDLRNAITTLETCNTDNSTYPASITPNSSGGACTSQTINTTSGTTLNYVTTATATQYALQAYASGGNTSSTSYYCYTSAAGGSVVKSTKTWATPTTLAAATPFTC